jgi:cytochrome c-type biogenesis protein
MQYWLLFFEGIITFISPCLLPLLPIYVSYFAAGTSDRRRTLVNSLGFVLGFTFVFVVLGAFAGLFGRLLIQHQVMVNAIAGGIVILFGLYFMGIVRLKFWNSGEIKADVKDLKFFTSLIFGIVFSISWTPCVGAFLGTALMMASTSGSVFHGVVMLLIYSMGLGIPFIISAVLLDKLKGAFDFIKRNYRAINIVSGIFLVLIGALMATGLMGRYMALII